MPGLHLTLLGGFEARQSAGPVVALGRRQAQALLAYLVVEPGDAHLRDKLAALLWGDCSDQLALQSLRQTLLAIRQALPQTDPELPRIDADSVAVGSANGAGRRHRARPARSPGNTTGTRPGGGARANQRVVSTLPGAESEWGAAGLR